MLILEVEYENKSLETLALQVLLKVIPQKIIMKVQTYRAAIIFKSLTVIWRYKRDLVLARSFLRPQPPHLRHYLCVKPHNSYV